MIAIEQYRAAIGCFHPKCFASHNNIGNVNELLKLIVVSLINWIQGSIDQCFGSLVNVNELLKLMVVSLINWIQGSIDTCFGSLVNCFDVNNIAMRLMFCIPVLQLHVLVLWMQLLLLLSGDVETNPGPVCQKCLADTCICSVKVKPRRRPSKQCPACASPVPCRRMICECGYDFIKCVIGHTPDKASKRKANRNAVAASRANETPEQSLECKTSDKNARSTLRANETPEQSLERKTSDKNARSSSRANETPEQSLERTKQNKSNMTKLRQLQLPDVSARQNLNAKFRMASVRTNEDVESSINRVTQSRLRMQQSRHKLLSIDEAMLAFHAKIKEGPDYVCTVCHRMMYKLGVVVYSRDNYCKGDLSILELVNSFEFVCADGRQWICRTCNVHLKRSSLPVQAEANGLALCNVPNELSDLKPLE